MRKHVVLAGGGHAHMLTLANLQRFTDKGHRVTVIGPSEFHYYSGMGPGMLGKIYSPETVCFQTRRLVEAKGGRFVLGQVVGIDPINKTLTLESGEQWPYDMVSFNVGSKIPSPPIEGDSEDIFTVKPIEGLLIAQRRLLALSSERSLRLGIVGGGPSSAEIAGNVQRLLHDHGQHPARITIFAGKKFMGRFSNSVRSKVANSLQKRSVHILDDAYVTAVKDKRLMLSSGDTYETDFLFLAGGVKPSPVFRASGLSTGPEGGLAVNEYLQSTNHPDVFGGGDCIYFQKCPLNKVGVYAVRQNPVLLSNLQARLEGHALTPFKPGGDYLLVFNLGDGTGVLKKRSLVFNGQLAFRIKDWIDRRFMKTFQNLE